MKGIVIGLLLVCFSGSFLCSSGKFLAVPCGKLQCSEDAICHKGWWLLSSDRCECAPGYSGDGHICNDIDECLLGTHKCSVHAVCSNLRGTYRCTCNSGFYGSGLECSDIDECITLSNPCGGDHLVCVNTKGSFECKTPFSISTDGTYYYIIVAVILYYILFFVACNDEYLDGFTQMLETIILLTVEPENEQHADYQYYRDFVTHHLPAVTNLLYQRFTLISFGVFAYFYFWWKYFIIGEVLDRIPFWHNRMLQFSSTFGNHTLWILLLLTNLAYCGLHYLELSSARLEVFAIILEGIISEFNRNRVVYKLIWCREHHNKWKVLLEAILMEIAPVNLLQDLITGPYDYNLLIETLCVLVLLMLFIPTRARPIRSNYRCNAVQWCIELSEGREYYEKWLLRLENICILGSCMYFVVSIFFVSK